MKKRLRDSKSIEQDIPYGTAFTIGLISGMSQLYDRHSQFPVTFLYIAQNPPLWRVFHGGTIWIRTKDLFDVNEAL